LQPDLLAKKIRENLVSQRNKLEEYLTILEKENNDIIEEDADKLIAHIDLEKNIIEDLTDFKKILEPLEKMYSNSPYKKDDNLMNLKTSLDRLTGQVKEKSVANKEKLEIVLEKVKLNLANVSAKNKIFKNTYETARSTLVDING
jgi:hypothetical protein